MTNGEKRFYQLIDQYNSKTEEVAKVANQYQEQVPGMRRGEAIRLAEKHLNSCTLERERWAIN